jgi:hypothetical protein
MALAFTDFLTLLPFTGSAELVMEELTASGKRKPPHILANASAAALVFLSS